MAKPMVEIKNLHRVFRRDNQEITALKEINLDIPEGDFLALMGPSGSGKTTLLNIMAGLDRPSSGVVRIGDIEVQRLNEGKLAEWRNHHIGFVFQMFNLIPVLTAFENVELPLLLTGLSKRERREHVMIPLKLMGLSDRLNHYPRQLSGGQQQRVAIARAIVADPTIILADEPTGNLDAQAATDVLHLLQELNEQLNKTIIMVTHDPRAAQHAKHEQHLDKGMLLPSGARTSLEGVA